MYYKKSKSIPRFLSIGNKKHFRVWFQTTFVGADVLDGPLFKRLLTQGSLCKGSPFQITFWDSKVLGH